MINSQRYVELQGQVSGDQNNGTMQKVLSQGMEMWVKNPYLFWCEHYKILDYFFSKDVQASNSTLGHMIKYYGTLWKVLSQGMHMKDIYERPVSSGLKVMAKVKVFL